ncbi:MAG TPA: acetyl-coenzyme A synthetase N-terminal domain-containing protein, partial [Bacteroidota bacterium]|nr:acetyl-coenzyme A synthetase N-terminal domain-containing protein [Bacteroidota bacterium]
MAHKQLVEGEVFYPGAEIQENTLVKDWETVAARAAKDPEGFWSDEAKELEWYKRWDTVLDDSKKPFYKWFVNAQVNIIHNALDRHQKTYRKNKLAFVWVGENNEVRTYSYFALNREVGQFANVLR